MLLLDAVLQVAVVRNRGMFLNPQVLALVFWMVALMDSAMALVTLSMMAFRMPHR